MLQASVANELSKVEGGCFCVIQFFTWLPSNTRIVTRNRAVIWLIDIYLKKLDCVVIFMRISEEILELANSIEDLATHQTLRSKLSPFSLKGKRCSFSWYKWSSKPLMSSKCILILYNCTRNWWYGDFSFAFKVHGEYGILRSCHKYFYVLYFRRPLVQTHELLSYIILFKHLSYFPSNIQCVLMYVVTTIFQKQTHLVNKSYSQVHVPIIPYFIHITILWNISLFVRLTARSNTLQNNSKKSSISITRLYIFI